MSRPLNVLEIRSVRGTGGGPEKTILVGAAQADTSRYRVTVCYIRDTRDDVFGIDERAATLNVDYVEILERHSLDLSVWPALRRLVHERQIDIVHSHEYKTDLLAYLLHRWDGIGVVATAHGWTGHSAKERRLYYPADKRLLARFPRLIAVSSEIRHELLRYGASPDSTTVVLNGIDHRACFRDSAKEQPSRTAWGVRPGEIVIGAVGRLEPQKRFDALIDVFARLYATRPSLRLLVAGEGSLRTTLEQQLRARGLANVGRLVGHVHDVGAFHHALDYFVQSSDYEGTPNAVLEAMAFETPLVATSAGGTAELVANGVHGLVVPVNDSEALMAALDDSLRGMEQARRRASHARRRVESELSFEARMRAVEAIYDELMSRQKRPVAA